MNKLNMEDMTSSDFAEDPFARLSPHFQELNDSVYIESYTRAIQTCGIKNKVVIDVYSGLGFRALLAAKCGAARVFALEPSRIAGKLKQIVKANGFEDIITVIEAPIKQVRVLDHDAPTCVDVILSKWFGDGLLHNAQLAAVLLVRDRFLSAAGIMLPSRVTLHAVAMKEEEQTHRFDWDTVYGFSMGCVTALAKREPRLVWIDPRAIKATACCLKSIDTMECDLTDVSFSKGFHMQCTATTSINALGIYFEVHFDHGHCDRFAKLSFSTLPATIKAATNNTSQRTQWKQLVFLLCDAIAVKPGDVLGGGFKTSFSAQTQSTTTFLTKISVKSEQEVLEHHHQELNS
eukprot:m.40117 g.40117  ORF g.40117 m.40117 type:complete len:347 (-) comp18394_c0_seq1:29-1069(-)